MHLKREGDTYVEIMIPFAQKEWLEVALLGHWLLIVGV